MTPLLFLNNLPMLILVLCGFILARKGNVTTKAMADLLICIISPFVTFGAVAQIPFLSEYMLLPFIGAIISFIVSFISWRLGCLFFKDNTPNLIGLSCVAGNITYFALPILILLVGEKWVAPYLMIRLGIQICEMTWGYYIGARGKFNIMDSIYKLITFPPLYGVLLGILWNILNLPFDNILLKYWHYSIGAIVFCGMMMMGVALGIIKKVQLNKIMLSIFMLMRFCLWPALTISFVILDQFFFALFSKEIHIMFVLVGIVPLPINSIAYAIKLNLNDADMALCVTATTIFALFYIPIVMWLLTTLNILAL